MTLSAQDDAIAPEWFVRAVSDTPETGTFAVDDATIAYRAWGRSSDAERDVVLVHGGAAHSGWWTHIAPLLAADRRIVALDMSGHGDSDHRARYSLEGWADEVFAAIDASGLGERPVVVGHSLGGIAAATLARRADAHLGGVIIVDSPIGLRGRAARAEAGRSSFGLARRYPTRADVVARFHPVPAQPALGYVSAHIADLSVREVDGGWTWKFDPSFIRMTGEMPDTLDGLASPVVLIAAERGILSADARAAIAASGEVTVVEIADAGHAIMLDQPLALVDVVRDVLADWSR